MEYKKTIILLALVVFLLSIAGVSASEIDNTIASENANTIELSIDNDIEDNLQTSEENMVFTSTDYDEAIAQTDTEVLGADSATYSDLDEEIGHSGNITLTHKNYTYNGGGTIIISEANKVIDGNGAVIDMNGSTIMAFYIIGSGVTIKNLTIKNANYNGNGGAIYFESTGTVTNCNFTNNTATQNAGAIRMSSGSVENCNFVDNKATGGYGGAIYIYSGTVTNCNFTGNNATRDGGAVYFNKNSEGNVTNCSFTNNSATRNGGAIYFDEGSTGRTINCNFTNNSAFGDGGSIDFDGTGTVTNCNFSDNSATRGGAVYFMRNGEVTKCNFTNNKASGNGGAVYFMRNGEVTKCNFIGNTALSGGAVYFKEESEVTNCNFTGNIATKYGGAVYFDKDATGKVVNCSFTDNKKPGLGGAVFFYNKGNVTDCNFTGNTASNGGAVCFYNEGIVTNCNFADNSAYDGGAIYFPNPYDCVIMKCNFTNNSADYGGAIYIDGAGTVTCTVTNCNFTNNSAWYGSAVYFCSDKSTKLVSNSCFLNNRANAKALEVTKNDNNITITFTGKDNLLNAIYSRNDAEVTFTNVTYWGANGIANTGSSAIKPSRSNREAGQNITVIVVVNDEIVLNKVITTDENGMIVLDISAGENYYISARHDTDSYYTEAEKTNSTMKFNVNVTSQITNNRTVNITAKSNIYNEVMPGKLLFIVPNSDPINATYAGNGTWWAVHTFDDYAAYEVNASYIGLDNVAINNATITVSKIKTELYANAITTTYNTNKDLVITLKDSTGNALSGVKVSVDLNGAKTYTTDKNGQVKVQTKGLVPKTYTAKITFNGNTIYAKSTKNVKVTVKKATPKIIAKKKTFKKSVKTKKYTITLKDNTGKPIKNAKVRLIVKKITKKTNKKAKTNKKYKKNIKKTNKKGKATFNIKRNKKGKYTAIVKYYGNKYFKAITKKAKIIIK